MTSTREVWIEMPSEAGGLPEGVPGAASLAGMTRERVRTKIEAGKYRQGDVEYVRDVSFLPVKNSLAVSPQVLEKLRRLCQLWEVDLTLPREISSHRKFIGPVIVAAKRLLFPILRVFFKDTLRKQRDFNAAVIALVTDLANQSPIGRLNVPSEVVGTKDETSPRNR